MSCSDILLSLSCPFLTPSELCCYLSGDEIQNCKPLIFLKCCLVGITWAVQCLLSGNFITRSQIQNRSQSYDRGKTAIMLLLTFTYLLMHPTAEWLFIAQLLLYFITINTLDRNDKGACSHACLSQPSRKQPMICIDQAVHRKDCNCTSSAPRFRGLWIPVTKHVNKISRVLCIAAVQQWVSSVYCYIAARDRPSATEEALEQNSFYRTISVSRGKVGKARK